MPLHHLHVHVGVLPVSTHDIDLMSWWTHGTLAWTSSTKLVSIGHTYTHVPISWTDLGQATWKSLGRLLPFSEEGNTNYTYTCLVRGAGNSRNLVHWVVKSVEISWNLRPEIRNLLGNQSRNQKSNPTHAP